VRKERDRQRQRQRETETERETERQKGDETYREAHLHQLFLSLDVFVVLSLLVILLLEQSDEVSSLRALWEVVWLHSDLTQFDLEVRDTQFGQFLAWPSMNRVEDWL
jgi:hypothetical protein